MKELERAILEVQEDVLADGMKVDEPRVITEKDYLLMALDSLFKAYLNRIGGIPEELKDEYPITGLRNTVTSG